MSVMVVTSLGDLVIDLFTDRCPLTCKNFLKLCKLSENFQAPYTSCALLCFMSSIQCTVIALFQNHSISDWSLRSPIRLVSSLYAGVIGSALAFCLMSWTIQRKGPLYVSVFTPLLLVIVAFISWFLRMEKLYVGTLMGKEQGNDD